MPALLASAPDEVLSSIAKGKHPIPEPVKHEWGFVLCMGFVSFPAKALDFVREWRRRCDHKFCDDQKCINSWLGMPMSHGGLCVDEQSKRHPLKRLDWTTLPEERAPLAKRTRIPFGLRLSTLSEAFLARDLDKFPITKETVVVHPHAYEGGTKKEDVLRGLGLYEDTVCHDDDEEDGAEAEAEAEALALQRVAHS